MGDELWKICAMVLISLWKFFAFSLSNVTMAWCCFPFYLLCIICLACCSLSFKWEEDWICVCEPNVRYKQWMKRDLFRVKYYKHRRTFHMGAHGATNKVIKVLSYASDLFGVQCSSRSSQMRKDEKMAKNIQKNC